MGQRLYSRQKLTLAEPIDLSLLLKDDRSQSLGIIDGRSYGNGIDKVLNSLSPSQLVTISQSSNTYFRVFNGKRIDYIIEYPSIISEYLKTSNIAVPYSYELKGETEYNIGYIMCSDNATSRSFIDTINETLSGLYKEQYFFDVFYSELDGYSKNKFYQYFEEVFHN